MGLETFIIPSVDVGEAPVSIDHVLFNETYNGEALNISGSSFTWTEVTGQSME